MVCVPPLLFSPFLSSDLLSNGLQDKDRLIFNERFHNAAQANEELLIYTRFRCRDDFTIDANGIKTPKERLFEIKARPYILPGETQCRCIFASAQPYPSPTMATYVSAAP